MAGRNRAWAVLLERVPFSICVSLPLLPTTRANSELEDFNQNETTASP